MTVWDWMIVCLYFVASFGIGIYYMRRASRSTTEFFLGGRSMPWWLAGLSMVATTFAADTPLAVTELVATQGIAGNWLWWNMVIGGMLTVFFFARYWRRAGIMTDLEFIELRYSGRPAAFLRGFRSLYLGLFMNAIIMGWVNLAMATVLSGMFHIPDSEVFFYIGAAMVLTAIYSSLSGLWGVAVTDAFQFLLAMGGCILLAVLVVSSPDIGGLEGLRTRLPAHALQIFPVFTSATSAVTGVLALSTGSFLAYIGVQWWASWYPGAEPGGGGYIAQRMMSTRNERHAVFSVLFFQIAHYCLRPWPWILVGLATLLLYPQLPLADKKLGYILAMNDFLPVGVKGLLVAAFFAAYMSTIATHLNWGTSYLVHDFWRRFVQSSGSERHYVFVSRVVTLVLMVISLAVTTIMTTISGAWQFIIECGAGLGLVLILRWYWWRVNAWSEIVATIAPLVTYAVILFSNAQWGTALHFPESLFIIVGVTTVAWIAVTLLTAPTDTSVLDRFYHRIRPGGLLWRSYQVRRALPRHHARFATRALAWLSGVVLVYAILFAFHAVFFGTTTGLVVGLSIAVVSTGFLILVLRRSESDEEEGPAD